MIDLNVPLKKSFTTYIGVDIGKKGGICVMNSDNETYKLHKIPIKLNDIDIPFIKDILENIVTSHFNKEGSKVVLIFEKLGLIYGSSKATAFSMGYQSGIFEGIGISLGCEVIKIPAVKWQKEMFKEIPEQKKPFGKRDTKKMALEAAKKIIKSKKVTENFIIGGKRIKIPHDGLVDAFLIAQYAKNLNL
jgi:hypothetical protein